MPPELLQVGSLQPTSRTTRRAQHRTGVDPSIILPTMDPRPQAPSANKTDFIALFDPSPVPDWMDLVPQVLSCNRQVWHSGGRVDPNHGLTGGEHTSQSSSSQMGKEFLLHPSVDKAWEEHPSPPMGVLGISNHGYPARSLLSPGCAHHRAGALGWWEDGEPTELPYSAQVRSNVHLMGWHP